VRGTREEGGLEGQTRVKFDATNYFCKRMLESAREKKRGNLFEGGRTCLVVYWTTGKSTSRSIGGWIWT